MLKLAVLVSGGGTNLQAIIDAIDAGKITNAKIDVVISNNANAYALERAKNHGIEGLCISPKAYESRDQFNDALTQTIVDRDIDLVVLAGYLVIIPPQLIPTITHFFSKPYFSARYSEKPLFASRSVSLHHRVSFCTYARLKPLSRRAVSTEGNASKYSVLSIHLFVLFSSRAKTTIAFLPLKSKSSLLNPFHIFCIIALSFHFCPLGQTLMQTPQTAPLPICLNFSFI